MVSSWCHQSCQLSQGWLTQVCQKSKAASVNESFSEVISHLSLRNCRKKKKYGWVTVCFTSVATAFCVRDSEIQGQRLNCDCRKDGIGLSVRRGVEGLKWNFSVSVSREEWKRIWKTFELSHNFLFHFSLFLFLWFSRWVQTEVKAQSPCLFHRWIK